MMPALKLTPEIIIAAIDGFEAQKLRIDAQIADLRAMLPGGRTAVATPDAAPLKRKVSAAARRRMALGQQKRWAAIKGTTESSSAATPKASKPKRKLSAAGRANIVAALKKRWAAKKSMKTAPAVAKKAVQKAAAKKAAAKKAVKTPEQAAPVQ